MINTQQNNLACANVAPDKLPLTILAFSEQAALVKFSFSELVFDFSALTIGIERTANELTVKAKVYDYLKLVLTLQGKITEDNIYFQTKTGSLALEQKQENTEANFVANSLSSIFALGGDVLVVLPNTNLNIKLYFDLPLTQISYLLKNRCTAYQSMITKSSGTSASTKSAYNSFIQDLIRLENNLDNLLFEKYSKLAEASLSSLSEEEKQAIHPRKEAKKLY